MAQGLQFVGGEGGGQHLFTAFSAHYGGETRAYVRNAVEIFQEPRDGEDGMLVEQDGLQDAAEHHRNGELCGAFAGDDILGCFPYAGEESLAVSQRLPRKCLHFRHREPGNSGPAPQGNLCVAVLSYYVGVNVARVDSEVVA